MAHIESVDDARTVLEKAVADVDSPHGMLANVGETMGQLREGIAWVDTEIRRQVTTGREDLLSQVRALHAMETVLATVKCGAENLASTVTFIHDEMSTPYREMGQHVRQLERLYNTSALMRDVQHFLWLCKKLRSHIEAPGGDAEATELERAAGCVFDIERLRYERQKEFAGIPVLHAKILWAGDVAAKVRSRAQSLLFRAVTDRRQTQAGNTLQAFRNLGMGAMANAVQIVATRVTQTARERLCSTLDPGALSAEMKLVASQAEAKGSSQRSGAAAGNLRVVSLINSMLDKTLVSCGDLLHVQSVLEKKRDAATGSTLAEQLAQESKTTASCFQVFWSSLSSLFARQLQAAFTNDMVMHAFVAEYPQFVGLFKGFLRQLQSHSVALGSHEIELAQPILSVVEEQAFIGALASLRQPFKDAFANRCNMFIRRSFSGSSVPPKATDVASFCQLLAAELARVLDDDRLLRLTMDTVVECVNEFSSRTQRMIAVGPEAYQLSGHVNNSQMKNMQLFKAMCALHEHVNSDIRRCLERGVKIGIRSGSEDSSLSTQVHLEELDQLSNAIKKASGDVISPLFNVICTKLEGKIFGIHKQSFGDLVLPQHVAGEHGVPCSQYMAEFSEQVDTVANLFDHYERLSPIFQREAAQLVTRLVDYSTRQIALLGTYRKVLPQNQRDILHGDMAQLEHALASLYALKNSEVSGTRKTLHSFRQLLFCDTLSDILANVGKLTSLPISTVVDYSFSVSMVTGTTATSVPHPYTVRGEDLVSYSDRLDEQDDGTTWELTKAYLKRHVTKMEAQLGADAPDIPQAEPTVLDIGIALEDAKIPRR
jgi:hypothetical protein